MYSSKLCRFAISQGVLFGRLRTRISHKTVHLVRCCSSGINKFDVKQLAPSPDAFIQRHIGPSEEEQKEMLKSMNLEVGLCSFVQLRARVNLLSVSLLLTLRPPSVFSCNKLKLLFGKLIILMKILRKTS